MLWVTLDLCPSCSHSHRSKAFTATPYQHQSHVSSCVRQPLQDIKSLTITTVVVSRQQTVASNTIPSTQRVCQEGLVSLPFPPG